VVAGPDVIEHLEVAALGPAFGPLVEMPFDQSAVAPDLGWQRLPRVAIEVRRDATLGEILTRAAGQLGVRAIPNADLPEGWRPVESEPDPIFDLPVLVGFFVPGDGPAVRSSPKGGLLPVVDAQGAVHMLRFKDAPIGGLLDAYEGGLMEGDPRRPYLVLYPPGGGDLLLSDWEALRQAVRLAWDIAAVISQVAWIGAASRWLLQRLRRLGKAAEPIAAESVQLSDRGLDPIGVSLLLRRRDRWTTADVARLLACTPQHAEGLLVGLGWKYCSDEAAWRPGRVDLVALSSEPRIADTLVAARDQPLRRRVLRVGRAVLAVRWRLTRDKATGLRWRIVNRLRDR
jgi:hypothetical protein